MKKPTDFKVYYAVGICDDAKDRIFLFNTEDQKRKCVNKYLEVAEMLFEAAPEEFSTYADVFQYVKDFLEQKDKQ